MDLIKLTVYNLGVFFFNILFFIKVYNFSEGIDWSTAQLPAKI